jgi:Uma2 family endonuclease
MSIATEAVVDDLVAQLYTIEGKAEIVDGRIVEMSPTGDMPNSAELAIAVSLRQFAKIHGGRAYGDNVAFLVDLPKRKSFSPDAAYFVGQRSRMKFLEGAPLFAVEVRSENDYGRAADKRIAAKRADYFDAGTKVVWDVDLMGDETIRMYCPDSPNSPKVFRQGEIANAEPAVPGWTFAVDELFD